MVCGCTLGVLHSTNCGYQLLRYYPHNGSHKEKAQCHQPFKDCDTVLTSV